MPEHLDHKLEGSSSELASGVKGKISFSQTNHHLYSNNVRRASGVERLPQTVKSFVERTAEMCGPSEIHLCDGSENENRMILEKLKASGTIIPLPKYQNCWLARTDPRDVARVESKTFICTPDRRTTVPQPKDGIKGQLGNWMSPEDMDKAVKDRFPGCMKNRTMYVIPFSMGPVGSPLSKSGVQVTDSPYVVASMRIMTRVGPEVLEGVDGQDVVRALHSVGGNGLKSDYPGWPCDPARTIILHRPESNEIVSYGSGYGGNSLLGKKCFALRIGSTIAKKEGWLAEHMLILGVTPPDGKKKYIAAAFPSACGKTNLAMMLPTLEGYKIECVGDDIAWIKYNPATKMLHAINPEKGFFGVAPGTSTKTNPNAMATVFKNTIFTNVAETSDGGVWWEGMEGPDEGVTLTNWLGKPHDGKTPAAHPNSRFCSPAEQCPIIDPLWEDPQGVPLSAILFGGRRPQGVPLVYEAFSWEHGVFIGASMRSEATAAAEHQGKVLMHDPFAMRPFFGYNFGDYLRHWLSIGQLPGASLPKIFHVNWFRKGRDGSFLWPGFGENIRVIDWILERVSGEGGAVETPLGHVPSSSSLDLEGLPRIDTDQLLSVPKDFWLKEGSFLWPGFGENIRVIDWILERVSGEGGAVETPLGHVPSSSSLDLEGLPRIDTDQLLSVPKDFWLKEVEDTRRYFEEQLPQDLPKRISQELEDLERRLSKS